MLAVGVGGWEGWGVCWEIGTIGFELCFARCPDADAIPEQEWFIYVSKRS